MSWQPISYWALRCDGETTRGQCDQLLYSDPDAMVVPVAWTQHGDVHYAPTLFTAGCQRDLSEQWMREHGWLKTDSRILCPDHIAALEKQAEAEINGLPFEQGVQQ